MLVLILKQKVLVCYRMRTVPQTGRKGGERRLSNGGGKRLREVELFRHMYRYIVLKYVLVHSYSTITASKTETSG